MLTEIDEPVQVESFFPGSGITPRWFLWNGRKIVVKQITQSWEERESGRKIRHFAVYDGQSVFNIIFDPEKLRWTLAGISDGL